MKILKMNKVQEEIGNLNSLFKASHQLGIKFKKPHRIVSRKVTKSVTKKRWKIPLIYKKQVIIFRKQ